MTKRFAQPRDHQDNRMSAAAQAAFDAKTVSALARMLMAGGLDRDKVEAMITKASQPTAHLTDGLADHLGPTGPTRMKRRAA